MSVTEPPKDTPFGLEANIAAGLSYLFIPIVAIIMLVGGGTNKFVKWHACQAISLAIFAIVAWVALIVLGIIFTMIHLGLLISLVGLVLWFAIIAGWLWGIIGAFMGKEVRLPVVADINTMIFKGALA